MLSERLVARAHEGTSSIHAVKVLLSEVRPRVEARLAALFEEVDADARLTAPEALPVIHAARDLTLRGGKRMRAALVYAAIECVEPGAYEQVACEVGAALELLQAWLLAHDDWMDGSLTLRGAPTAHASLTVRYRDPHRGACGAVLAGDLLAALAHEVLGSIDLPWSRRRQVVATFAGMERDVLLGQCLDMDQCRDAWRVYDLKTGAYSVRGPLLLGATIAGASDDAKRALDGYATPLGRAFQLRDDLLDLFGREEHTGKTSCRDIREGKATPLVAHALEHLGARDREVLLATLGRRDAPDEEVFHARALIERSGARARFETEVHALRTRSLEALDEGALRPEGRRLLEGLALLLTERQT